MKKKKTQQNMLKTTKQKEVKKSKEYSNNKNAVEIERNLILFCLNYLKLFYVWMSRQHVVVAVIVQSLCGTHNIEWYFSYCNQHTFRFSNPLNALTKYTTIYLLRCVIVVQCLYTGHSTAYCVVLRTNKPTL